MSLNQFQLYNTHAYSYQKQDIEKVVEENYNWLYDNRNIQDNIFEVEDIEKVKLYDFLILQPAQNPEVLRKFLYNNNFEILNEDLILDDGKFYELFKVKYNENAKKINVKDEISYEISSILLESNNSLVNDYIKSKIKKYENIITYIKDDTSLAKKKKDILNEKINKLKEMIS